MTVDLLTHTTDQSAELLERAEPDGPRRVLVRLFRWDEVADTPQGRESFPRGAFADLDPTQVVIESERHGGALVGRGESYEERDDGPYLVGRISNTSAGRDLAELIRDGVTRAVSVSFQPITTEQGRDGVLVRARAALRRVAILPSGAYRGAQVLEMRNEAMTEEVTTQPAQAPQAPPAPPAPDLTPVLERMDRLDAAVAQVQAGHALAGSPAPTLDRFDTFGQAFMAATTDPAVAQELHRALADNTLSANPGLAGLANSLSRVVDRIYRGRPIVSAFGAESPGDSGMSVSWPVFDDTSTFSVDTQAGEKDPISSGTTKYKVGTATLQTIAGGSDNSLQVLERSTPAFRELLLRNYAEEYALKADALMGAALVADGTAYTDGLELGTADDAAALLAALFGMSSDVEDATGYAANVALAAPDVWKRLGMVTGLMPRQYGTQNVAGTADAASLTVSASGLTIRKGRSLPAGRLVLAYSGAATFLEDGPRTIEATNVAQLGRDTAIYGFVAPVVLKAGGVQVATVTEAAPAAAAVGGTRRR